eukprot:scaffold259789_cov30-Tisochrysis_lutea.AAC.4
MGPTDHEQARIPFRRGCSARGHVKRAAMAAMGNFEEGRVSRRAGSHDAMGLSEAHLMHDPMKTLVPKQNDQSIQLRRRAERGLDEAHRREKGRFEVEGIAVTRAAHVLTRTSGLGHLDCLLVGKPTGWREKRGDGLHGSDKPTCSKNGCWPLIQRSPGPLITERRVHLEFAYRQLLLVLVERFHTYPTRPRRRRREAWGTGARSSYHLGGLRRLSESWMGYRVITCTSRAG